ncbi:hypothetical protein L228DRAFT_106480 [Xylona heveae TC161]|uniref:Zn(2)-C6 fungal-type domain-containing protein n=1 Tax=Xylona heveae (strain CBS 132557 / TC161) TaxID=1328760 RepID=A0A165HAG4_XYLHT|nr:hypothetical protein L228DRAFT_106480 [Xylona heveae TC161]KZF23212.1 hypothetical protein L228DRAFT_106480 [Xylona heveae TC161]
MKTMQSSSFHRFRISQPQPADSVLQQRQSGDVRKSSEAAGSSSKKSSSTSACRRCRRLKKKCSKTLPTCSLCENAGLPCSLSAAPSVASVPNTPIDQLQARISWLSKCLQDALPADHPLVETLTTGALVAKEPTSSKSSVAPQAIKRSSVSSSSSNTFNLARELTPESSHAGHGSPHHGPATEHEAGPDTLHRMSATPTQPAERDSSKHTGQRMTQEAAGRKFVDSYFSHVHRCYPFINRAEIMEDLEAMAIPGKLDAIPSRLYIIMAIGCNTLQRAGRIPCGICVKFQISYHKIIQECLGRKDVESVQVLLLLGLYSFFDPGAVSPWVTAGILCRQIMLLGLNKKAPPELNLSPLQIELRHRLLWSAYIFDRMVSVSAGLPVGIDDQDIEIPLPSLTVEEYAGDERASNILLLQSKRHMIALRRLEGKILQRVHLSGAAASSLLGPSERIAIVQNIMSEIVNWHSQGYLLSPAAENETVPSHNSIPWLNVRYQNLLFLLQSPSSFNSQLSPSHVQELQLSAQKYIQSSSLVFSQRRLALNWITLCRLMTASAVFLFCYTRTIARGVELRDEVLACANILDEYPETWQVAKQLTDLLRRFAAVTDSMAEGRQSILLDLHVPSAAHLLDHHGGPSSNCGVPGDSDFLYTIRAELKSLMSRVLGESSAYHSILGAAEVRRYRPLDLSSIFQANVSAGAMGTPASTEVPPQHQHPLQSDFDGPFDSGESWTGSFGEFSTDWM